MYKNGYTLTLVVTITMATLMGRVQGHGYMLEPPSRQSAARVGFDFVPWNPDDNQLYCGGKAHQWDVHDGRCGVCGDPWDEVPRSYEYPDGRYVKGIPPVNKVYAMGQTVEIVILLTQSHLGYFVFRLCNRDRLDAPDATEDCLDQHVLHLENGDVRYRLPRNCNGIYKVKVKLPEGLTCAQCFLQWKYHAGNDYGCFENGPCCTGCGKRQEEFYACADIVIRDDVPTTPSVRGIRATCGVLSDNETTTTYSWSTTTPTTITTTTTTTTTKTTTNAPTTTTTPTTTPTPTTTVQPTTTTTLPPSTTTTTITTPTTSTTTIDPLVALEMRCRGQGSSCAVYCTPGLYVLCEAIPQCQGCRDYLNGGR